MPACFAPGKVGTVVWPGLALARGRPSKAGQSRAWHGQKWGPHVPWMKSKKDPRLPRPVRKRSLAPASFFVVLAHVSDT